MKYILGIITTMLVIAVGYFVGHGQKQPASIPVGGGGVSIYFLKPDGVFQIDTAKEGEAQLVEGSFRNLFQAGDKLLAASDSAIVVYQLALAQTTVIEPVTPEVTFNGLAVSPDGAKVAYVKNIQVGDIGFKNELWLLDLTTGHKLKLFQEPELGADPEGVVYLLALNGWLDDQRVLVGRAYEGVSFCPFTVGVDSKLPNNCSESAVDADAHLKVTAADGQTQYLIKSSDIYSFNLSDETSKRLTHDATSVDTKESLRLSNKGRFLTYDSKEISTNAVKAWLYDLKLQKYYPLGDNTFSAVVVEN